MLNIRLLMEVTKHPLIQKLHNASNRLCGDYLGKFCAFRTISFDVWDCDMLMKLQVSIRIFGEQGLEEKIQLFSTTRRFRS